MFEITTATEPHRVGKHIEYACMSNPYGHIYVDKPAIYAQSDYGMCYRYCGEIVDEAHAERLELIFKHQILRGDFNPENDDDWFFSRYVYGSKAFVDNYAEATCAMMDSEELDFHRNMGGGFW